jgi:hypothetical protein
MVLCILDVFVLAGIILRPCLQVTAKGATPADKKIECIVCDDKGTISGASVRIQTTGLNLFPKDWIYGHMQMG